MSKQKSDWDVDVGNWLDGVPYVWKNNRMWKKCSREYILPRDFPPLKYLPGAEKCANTKNFFKVKQGWLHKNIHKQIVKVNGVQYSFPTPAFSTNHLYDYIGIKYPTKDKINMWHLHLTSTVGETSQDLDLPVYTSKLEHRGWGMRNIYMLLWYLQQVNKYPGVCMPVGTKIELKNYDYGSGLHSIGIIGGEGPNFKVRVHVDPSIAKVVKWCSKSPKIKYIILHVLVGGHESGILHSNLILIDMGRINDDGSKTVYLFDPWGKGGYDLTKGLPMIMKKLGFSSKEKWTYKSGSEWCPIVAFQSLETREIVDKYKNVMGFCEIWSMWFMDVLLRNPNVKPEEIIRRAQNQMAKNNPDFVTFINNYFKFFEKNAREQKKKLKLKYSSPGGIDKFPYSDVVKIQKHARAVRNRQLRNLKKQSSI